MNLDIGIRVVCRNFVVASRLDVVAKFVPSNETGRQDVPTNPTWKSLGDRLQQYMNGYEILLLMNSRTHLRVP